MRNTALSRVFELLLCSSLLLAPAPAAASALDHAVELAAYGITGIASDADTVFSPMLHSPGKPFDASVPSFGGTLMPLVFMLNEKYFLYPENAKASDDLDRNISKYAAKAVNLSVRMAWKSLVDCVSEPSWFAWCVVLSNLSLSWPADAYASSVIRQTGRPLVAVTTFAGGQVDARLVYCHIDASEYSIYLIYSPFSPPSSNHDMYSDVLVFDRASSRFIRFSRDASGAVSSAVPAAVVFVDPADTVARFDRFERLSGPRFGFAAAFDALKLLAEKKIVRDETGLRAMRLWAFLPANRRAALLELLKNVKSAVLEPSSVGFVSGAPAGEPLQVEMGGKNRREQEQAVIRKFTMLYEKHRKMSLNLVPRSEFDLTFRKVYIGNK